MNIQAIDLPSLLRAILWPGILVTALVIFRQQLPDLVRILSQRINKFSFAGVSLELALLPEAQSAALEIEVRQLNAAPQVQSGADSISGIFGELQRRAERGYIVIDLGSESAPRWLTSRLYLLASLITLLDRPIYLVFVETAGELRKRFVGIASSNAVRWALARRYSWLESAMAAAYAVTGGAYCDANSGIKVYPVSGFQFDPAAAHLASWQVTQLMQQFLFNNRVSQPAPETALPDAEEWITLNDGTLEHAKWADAARMERLLGGDLSTSSVALWPNQSIDSLGELILEQPGPFVAVLEADRTFRSLVDRSATLDNLGSAYLKQTRSEVQTAVGVRNDTRKPRD
jgi:hypothetical protein